jgi:hypothetical protein
MEEPLYYRARINFEFGGVKVKAGDIVPGPPPALERPVELRADVPGPRRAA